MSFINCSLCNYKCKILKTLEKHIGLIHNETDPLVSKQCNKCDKVLSITSFQINSRYIDCLSTKCKNCINNLEFKYACDLCNYKSKRKQDLRTHKAIIHEENLKWFNCDLCDFKSKSISNLNDHIKRLHTNNYFIKCDLCSQKFNSSGNLIQHRANIHDINVTWFNCDLCSQKFKSNGNLIKHKANIHDIGVTWFDCDLCSYKCKTNSSLKTHKSFIHDIGVTWFKCDLCNHKTKDSGSLKIHLSNIHDINVNWFHCPDPNCDYQSKSSSHIKRHYQALHSEEAKLIHKKEEHRIEKLLERNEIFFKREEIVKFDCFRSDKKFARIDFVVYKKGFLFLLEVDECQHENRSYSVRCDIVRMNNIITALKCKIVFIRYNPNIYYVNGKKIHKPKKTRELELIDFITKYKPTQDIEIKYMFYDSLVVPEVIPLIVNESEYCELFKSYLLFGLN